MVKFPTMEKGGKGEILEGKDSELYFSHPELVLQDRNSLEMSEMGWDFRFKQETCMEEEPRVVIYKW